MDGAIDYVIRDVTGKVTGQGQTSGEINVSALPSGTYLLSILSEREEVTTRFVKK